MFSVSSYTIQTLGRVGLSYHNPNDPTPLGTDFLYDDRIGRSPLNAFDNDTHYFTISNGDVGGSPKKQIYADGVQYVDGTAAIDSSLGLEHYIGQWNNSIGQFQIAELIAYNIKHSPTQQAEAETYLKSKYNIII